MTQNATLLAREFDVREAYINNIIQLLDEGNTIPFIARYRKEMHGSMDDQLLREIADRLDYLRNLDKRREEIISSLTEQEKLTDELKAEIAAAETLARLEDIYRPYKPKRRTRAMIAKEKGLEPLAVLLYLQQTKAPLDELAAPYISPEKDVVDANAALTGASDILAEMFSDDAEIRQMLREWLRKTAQITAKAATEEDSVYANYYDYKEAVSHIQGHRVLALDRGEKEKMLKVSILADDEHGIGIIQNRVVRSGSSASNFVAEAAADAYNRLIFPSMERELRSELTAAAAEQAIRTFALNLRPLLMQPPVRGKVTLGFDPAYRTGCKLAVVDATGKVLETGVVYPTPPHNKTEEAKSKLTAMIKRHHIEAIAIGNGTASKESEIFVTDMLQDLPDVAYMMVNEAGASVYSASKLGAAEFPDLDVSVRSAISIARRLQDPLAELVKIDPKSIGVGQYQHDMPQNRLESALFGVVEDCVNTVGVDINTASPSLLSHIAGLNSTTAKNIVAYREENGPFASRTTIKKVPKIGPKAFQQCAGFLRIPNAKNIMDNTGVHPESYTAAEELLKLCGFTANDVKGGKVNGLAGAVKQLGEAALAEKLGIGVPTIWDIVSELQKPGRDPREELPPTLLRRDIMDMSDLKPGMVIRGTVRNVVDFGVFVDIGVHQDGLVHISELCSRFVKHPSEVCRVGDIVDTLVLSVDVEKKRISLSIKQAKGK